MPLPSGLLLFLQMVLIIMKWNAWSYNTVSSDSEVHAAESIIVGTFQPEPGSVPRFAVFTVALIRDALRDHSIELLSDACCTPRWRVMLYSGARAAAALAGGPQRLRAGRGACWRAKFAGGPRLRLLGLACGRASV